VALKFCLLPTVVTGICVGVKSREELGQVVAWFAEAVKVGTVPTALFAEAKRRGLLAKFAV
jgi:hypothetical protein